MQFISWFIYVQVYFLNFFYKQLRIKVNLFQNIRITIHRIYYPALCLHVYNYIYMYEIYSGGSRRGFGGLRGRNPPPPLWLKIFFN